MDSPEHEDELADHWWWRPGWKVGTRFYAWHINLFEDPLRGLAAEHQRELSTVPGLDLIPLRWLHLTMQGVGFREDVPDARVDALLAAARVRLAELEPAKVRFHRPVVRREAVLLPADPAEPLRTIRYAVRAAIADVCGGVPENADGYRPHISLAYANTAQPAAPIIAALDRVNPTPADLILSTVSLIEMHRDNRMYQWRTVEAVPLGLNVR
ncbi:2'-5' RNA ligase family protein [Kribbella sp. NPDC003557]|uniref:2'-5' RNA ligase family protein n=1 Tax=Kribbella sp. NPDC003557 TaxID=3154449 RepID=UPI0033A5C097